MVSVPDHTRRQVPSFVHRHRQGHGKPRALRQRGRLPAGAGADLRALLALHRPREPGAEPGRLRDHAHGHRGNPPRPRPQGQADPGLPELLPPPRREGLPLRPGQRPRLHLPLPRLDLRLRRARLVGAAGINNPASYAGALDRDEWGLVEVGQFKNYYGTLWATWDKKAPSFEDYLGPFAESVALHGRGERRHEDDGLEVFTPFQKWRLPTNWKIPAFTSVARPGARGDDAPLRQRRRHRPDARRRATAAAGRRAARPHPIEVLRHRRPQPRARRQLDRVPCSPASPTYRDAWYEARRRRLLPRSSTRRSRRSTRTRIMPPQRPRRRPLLRLAELHHGQLALALLAPARGRRRRALEPVRRRQGQRRSS